MLTLSVLLLPLLLSSPLVSSSPLAKDQSVCARTFCGAGRECVSTDRGEPVCRCLQQCDATESWVCGSNGRSYRNHCELHRDACTTRNKIHVQHPARCPEKPPKADASPVACFLLHCDGLRESAVRWIREEARSNVTAADALLRSWMLSDENADWKLITDTPRHTFEESIGWRRTSGKEQKKK
ncbi:follistatin-related protein 1-like [Pungitius pungitius]|uniref:follistatin-related protein 1-like n=1 Tax=Pungitius pungitius TaxID=134920 RepID=UPI002E0E625F